MSEFKASDKEVRDIAAIFALKHWTWAQKGGRTVPDFVPKAGDIAGTLNMLYQSARASAESNSGVSRTGRLFVSWIDEGYGPDISFGIEWNRLPMGDTGE